MHVVTLAIVMIVTGVETKMSDVTMTSVVTPISVVTMTVFATLTSSVIVMSGVTLISVVTDECCDPGDFCDFDRDGDE